MFYFESLRRIYLIILGQLHFSKDIKFGRQNDSRFVIFVYLAENKYLPCFI